MVPRAQDQRPLRAIVLVVLLTLARGPSLLHAQAVQISQGETFSQVLNGFRLSADGRLALYQHDAEADSVYDLWSTSTTAGQPVRLSPPIGSGQVNGSFTADGTRVVYGVGGDAFSVPATGPSTESVLLSEDLLVWDTSFEGFLFYVTQSSFPREYRTVPIAGPISATRTVYSFSGDFSTRLSNAAGLMAFAELTMGPNIVRSVDLNADPFVLSDVTPVGTNAALPVAISSDGATIVLRDGEDIYAVPFAGPAAAAVELTGLLTGNVFEGLSADGTTVLFRAAVPGGDRLYSVPVAGPAASAEPLSGAIPDLGSTQVVARPSGGDLVLYSRVDVGVQFLEAVPLAGPASATTTVSSESPGSGTGLVKWEVAPTGKHVVMEESRLGAGVTAGYRQDLRALDQPSELVWTILVDPETWLIHPDGSELLLSGVPRNVVGASQRLWTASLTGAPTLETEILDGASLPGDFEWDSSSVRYGSNGVVVLEAVDSSGREELFSVGLVFEDDFETGDTSRWDVGRR